MSWRCLQNAFSVTIFRLPRRLQDVFKTYLKDAAFKAFWRRLGRRKRRLSVLNHGLLNLNQYLTNLYLTNLYFKNLRRIKKCINYNPVTYFETHSTELIQNRHCRTGEAIKTSHKYNEWSFILTFIFNLHLKKLIYIKKILHICLSTEGETK